MTNSNFKSGAAKLAALDLTEHLSKMAEAKRQRGEIQSAINRGMESIGRLGKEMDDVRAGRTIDADAAADAMISGEGIALETRSAEQIQSEMDAMRAGLTRLRQREEEAGRAEAPAKSAAINALAACVAEIPPVLLTEAQGAVASLASVFAAATALSEATCNGQARDVAGKIGRVLAECRSLGLIGHAPVTVPNPMLDLLEVGRAPIHQLGRSWPDSVSVL